MTKVKSDPMEVMNHVNTSVAEARSPDRLSLPEAVRAKVKGAILTSLSAKCFTEKLKQWRENNSY